MSFRAIKFSARIWHKSRDSSPSIVHGMLPGGCQNLCALIRWYAQLFHVRPTLPMRHCGGLAWDRRAGNCLAVWAGSAASAVPCVLFATLQIACPGTWTVMPHRRENPYDVWFFVYFFSVVVSLAALALRPGPARYKQFTCFCFLGRTSHLQSLVAAPFNCSRIQLFLH